MASETTVARPRPAGVAPREGGGLLEGVLHLLAGLLEVAGGLLTLALGLQIAVVGGPADGLLRLAGQLVDLVARLVVSAHAAGGTRPNRPSCDGDQRRPVRRVASRTSPTSSSSTSSSATTPSDRPRSTTWARCAPVRCNSASTSCSCRSVATWGSGRTVPRASGRSRRAVGTWRTSARCT